MRELLVGLFYVSDDLLGMRLANDLVTRQNEHQLEVRVILPHLVGDRLDHCDLVKDLNRLAIFVEEHSSGVTQLNNEDVLFSTSGQGALEELLEKIHIFAEITDSGKLWLKLGPNVMALKLLSL